MYKPVAGKKRKRNWASTPDWALLHPGYSGMAKDGAVTWMERNPGMVLA